MSKECRFHWFLISFVFAGASCPDGKSFVPLVNDSKWRAEYINGEHKMRILQCPPGYVLGREDKFPDQDRCTECPITFYSLVVATSNSTVCKPCPIGADCPGGNFVISKEGYWKKSNNMLRLIPDSADIPADLQVAAVFKCPPGLA
jgi:hypothetical protein